MTERWRKKLGDLDKQGPSDDVFDLAKQGPRLTDEPLPAMRPSTRIATAVAASAVFALRSRVLFSPALRMQGTEAGEHVRWPLPAVALADPRDELKQLQSDVDAGPLGAGPQGSRDSVH